jgi:hypothetical protein
MRPSRQKRGRAAKRNVWIPYETIEDLKGRNMLGIINETDAWMTGRPYGLPGTATVRLTRRANGVNYASTLVGTPVHHTGLIQPAHHTKPYIVGGLGSSRNPRGASATDPCCDYPQQPCCWDSAHRSARARMFGDAGTDQVIALQQIAASQKAQQEALEKIAFWQKLAGSLTVAGIVVGAVFGAVGVARESYELRRRGA